MKICIEWYVDDILSLDPSLTEEECMIILQNARDSHDANIGINWDVLQFHINEFKENKNGK
jgi:hypothetical protein